MMLSIILYICIYHLLIFFGEVSVQIFGSFLNQVVYFLVVEF